MEVPLEDYCTIKNKVQNHVQCETCKVSTILLIYKYIKTFIDWYLSYNILYSSVINLGWGGGLSLDFFKK